MDHVLNMKPPFWWDTGKLGKRNFAIYVKGMQIDTTNAAFLSFESFWHQTSIWVIVHQNIDNFQCQKKPLTLKGTMGQNELTSQTWGKFLQPRKTKWHANTSGLTINLRFIIRKAQNPMEAARDRPLHPRANVLKGFFWSLGFFYDFVQEIWWIFVCGLLNKITRNLMEKPHKIYGQPEKNPQEIHQNEFISPKKSSHWWNVMDMCHWGRLLRSVSLEVRQLPV